jgi:hypothetical protein
MNTYCAVILDVYFLILGLRSLQKESILDLAVMVYSHIPIIYGAKLCDYTDNIWYSC